MTIKRKSIARIIIVATTVVVLCTLCNAFAYDPLLEMVDRWPDGGDFYPEDYYKIDTNTIIPSLDQGTIDIFLPMTETEIPDTFWPDNVSYFQWSQSDYMKIATALNTYAGRDNITDWRISQVAFNSVCEANSNGFSTAYFGLFRPIWIKNQLHYEAREIFIDPLVSIARWGEGRTYPRPLFGWDNIRLDKFKITAEKALMIAEENGGKQVRLDKGNNCNIAVIGRPDEWLVLYSPFTEYGVDAYTGKITHIRKD